MFDIAGVDQPRVQPMRLEQVEHRLPIRRRRLHHHPLHTHLDQPIGQLGQCLGHRGVRRDFLQPPLTASWRRHPHTAHQLRLRDIQGGHPGNDLLLIMGLSQHGFLLNTNHVGVVARGYRNGDNESDPRARQSGNSQGPIQRHPTPGSIHGLAGDHSVRRRRQATTSQFSRPVGRPPGQNGSYADVSLGPPTSVALPARTHFLSATHVHM